MRALINFREITRSQRTRDALYDQVNKIPTYRKHRHNMRPWDRALPPMVEQEMTKRQLWELFPPSKVTILGLLAACVLGVVLSAIIPAITNRTRIEQQWRDMDKPSIVYHDGSVLFAVWVVVHICTGLAWWFVWLSRGFENHLRVVYGLGLICFLDAVWLDVVFYLKYLDVAIIMWAVSVAAIVWTQVFMIKDRIEIGALFMLPHLACAITIIVYLAAFMSIYGNEWSVNRFTLDQRNKFVAQFNDIFTISLGN